jgi:PAS domain S-box-containing protein
MLEENTSLNGKTERSILLNEAESIARMGSWKWIERTGIMIWSEGLYSLYAKDPNEAVSWTSFLDNVIQEDVASLEHFLFDKIIQKNGGRMTYRIRKEDRLRNLSLSINPAENRNPDCTGTVLDITERKLYENQSAEYNASHTMITNELDDKENRYRTLFERSIDPIFLVNENFSLLDVNHAFLKLFDYTVLETKALTAKNIFAHEADCAYFVKTLTEARQISNFEVDLITKSGVKKSCILNCVFIPHQKPELCWYQGIVHDLTFRKHAENDMRIAERLSLTGKIARTIAHEVRNPLTNLNLALDQLRAELPTDNESINLYTAIIERNARRIEQLVDEMLTSSKPRQPHLVLTSINEIIEQAISQALDRIKLEQVKFISTIEKGLPKILVDKADIQVALLNIMINAVESMKPGNGVLTIYATKEKNKLVVSITDNGKGIPAADMEHLFDPFFTNKHGGIGLGLTSTKNILNSHNAQVDVQSEPNKGTTFFIRFKLDDTSEHGEVFPLFAEK